MISTRSNLTDSMTIRSYLGYVLAGTLVCGLAIAGYFSWSFITLERMQYEVSSHSLALRELNYFGEGLDLMLVSSDLTIGSGETYAAQIAHSLSQKQRNSLEKIALDSTLPYDGEKITRLNVLFNEFESLIGSEMSVTSIPHDADRFELLSRFDAISGEITLLFEDVVSAVQEYARQKSNALTERRVEARIHHVLVLGLYFMANALLVFWSLRKIAWPVENLTRSATRAIADGSHFSPPVKGPKEIRRLAKHFVTLVSGLEQTVMTRTQALRDKTTRLENEITERKEIEFELQSAKEAAEKSSKVKSEFLSVMSHELRTPMNAVLGSLSLIREGGLTEEQEAYASIAGESGRALLELLGDVLDISKIEAEAIRFKNEPFSIPALISSTGEMLHERARKKGLRTSAVVDPDVPEFLVGDFGRLRQVLINLVSNAIKFTEEGSIDVSVSLVTRVTSHNLIRFDVTDSGVGVAESESERIFDTFSQLDTSMARQNSGVGLGLSICKHLVREMGGDCGVRSNVGVGSTFWFTVALPGGKDTGNGRHFSIPETVKPVLVISHGDAYAAKWLTNTLDSYATAKSIVRNFDEAESRLSSAIRDDEPYGCVVVAAQHLDSAAAESLEKLAAKAHAVGAPCMVLSEQPLKVTRTLMDKGLVDLEHIGCFAQHEVLSKITGNNYRQAPDAPSTKKTLCAKAGKGTDGTGVKVLVVEDNEVNQIIATATLGKAGHHAEAVSSGASALRKLRDDAFDLILMDLQMPEMDGLEVARAIRAMQWPMGDVPIIAFSANIMETTKADCIAAGMNDFVSKPFVTEHLLAKVAKWSNTSRKPDNDTEPSRNRRAEINLTTT